MTANNARLSEKACAAAEPEPEPSLVDLRFRALLTNVDWARLPAAVRSTPVVARAAVVLPVQRVRRAGDW